MIPKRVVIDTNVCLDLFVFHDSRWVTLLQALETGQTLAFTREDCRNEWLKVLDYRQLPLDEYSRPIAVERFDALIAQVDPAPSSAAHVALPLCTDPDDQKFLELARDLDVDALITKDKALLKLAGKVRRAGLFRIVPPEKWYSD